MNILQILLLFLLISHILGAITIFLAIKKIIDITKDSCDSHIGDLKTIMYIYIFIVLLFVWQPLSVYILIHEVNKLDFASDSDMLENSLIQEMQSILSDLKPYCFKKEMRAQQ